MSEIQTSSTSRTRRIVVVAMFSAIATVLMYLNFSVPFMPEFIKFDFAELPALLASFSLGPQYGVLVCLIKNLFHLLSTSTAGVGELSNFMLGVLFVLPAGLIYRMGKSRKSALLGATVGALLMAIGSLPLNYFVTYPFYMNIMPVEAIISLYQAIIPSVDGLLMCLLVFNVPFTLLKGVACTVITFLVYKRLSPIIKGTRK